MSDQNSSAIVVCMLGSPAAGKSTFIGGLRIWTEPDRASDAVLKVEGKAYDRMDEYAATLRTGNWIPPTSGMIVLPADLVMNKGKQQVLFKLNLLDYPGVFMNDLAKMDREKIRDLGESFDRANFILLLLDPVRDILPLQNATDVERKVRIDRLNALLSAIVTKWIDQNPEETKKNSPRLRPKLDVAAIITKADEYPNLFEEGAAENFLSTNAPEFYRNLENSVGHLKVLPLSAVGTTCTHANAETGQVEKRPDRNRIEPKGYREIFEWILWQREAARRWRQLVAGIAVAASVLLGVAGYFIYHDVQKTNEADRTTAFENFSLGYKSSN